MSERLRAEGLERAAAVVVGSLSAHARAALDASAGTPASELLAARVMAVSLHAVMPRYPDAAHALADHLARGGHEDLADAFADLAAAGHSADAPGSQLDASPGRRVPLVPEKQGAAQ